MQECDEGERGFHRRGTGERSNGRRLRRRRDRGGHFLLLRFRGRCVNRDRESIAERMFGVKGVAGLFGEDEEGGKVGQRGGRVAA